MAYLASLVGAYLIVGPIYVRRKLTAGNFLNTPFFLVRYQSEGGIGRLIATTLAWPLVTFINKEFFYWLAVAIIAAILIYLSNI